MGKWSLMSLSPGYDVGPQCVPPACSAELKVQERDTSPPFLLRSLSGSWARTPHHLWDLHPQHSAADG